MKNIAVVGLGLIGGSFAKAIKENTGYTVLGYDICEKTIESAVKSGVIDGVLNGKNLSECDFVIISLYPKQTEIFFKEKLLFFKKGTIVVDCAGVKENICKNLSPLANENGFHFIGGHPMAGIERSGFENSKAELFKGASMILCDINDKKALETAKNLFLSLGFGSINISSPENHDEIIAYTSQLAHVISSAYIKSKTAKKRNGFSAGSFKDLSRVAKLNENMWTELFFENKENLLKEIDFFIEEMIKYKKNLENNNKNEIHQLLKEGSKLKIYDEINSKS